MNGKVKDLTYKVRHGLGVLHSSRPKQVEIAEHDLINELRERYWIEKIEKKSPRKSSLFTISAGFPMDLSRDTVNRSRSDAGDGFFCYTGIDENGTISVQEWYEVTECFTTVDAQDINCYMRLENGMSVKPAFSQENFLQTVVWDRPTKSFSEASVGQREKCHPKEDSESDIQRDGH